MSVDSSKRWIRDENEGTSSGLFERAVFRAAPPKFTITILPVTKKEEDFNHGLRITSSSGRKRGSLSSSSSSASFTEYDIWRRWEDCLWFQDKLETDYKAAARQKRTRLLRGKGVKKDGMYLQDMASSWDSLPPGPAPASVAQDVHEIVPRLTKKGTFFGISQALLETRGEELKAFIEALFHPDAPALLTEVLATPSVVAFFGYWRTDYDLERKHMKQNLSAQFKDLRIPSSPYINDATHERSRSLFSLASLSSRISPPRSPKQEVTPVPLKSRKSSFSSSSQSSSSISSGSASNFSINSPISRGDLESIQTHENSQPSSPLSTVDEMRRSRLLTPQSPTKEEETYKGSRWLPQVQDNEIEEEESRDQVSSQLHLPHILKSPSASKPMSRHLPPINTVTNVSIKAVYSDCIISLRVPPSLPFMDVRHRIYTKLVGQEGVNISPSYTMTVGSLAVTSQADWDGLLLHSNSKITLRIT